MDNDVLQREKLAGNALKILQVLITSGIDAP